MPKFKSTAKKLGNNQVDFSLSCPIPNIGEMKCDIRHRCNTPEQADFLAEKYQAAAAQFNDLFIEETPQGAEAYTSSIKQFLTDVINGMNEKWVNPSP